MARPLGGVCLLLALLPHARAFCVITPDADGHVDYPASETTVPSQAFVNCDALVSITLPAGVTFIGTMAFYGCEALASITLPSGLASIGDGAFAYCDSLASITLPLGLTSIGDKVFRSCGSLASITLPLGLTSIGSQAFRDSGLTSIALPSALSSIGEYAFNGCSNLGLVHVPAGCTVGSFAFYSTAAPAPGYVLGLPPAPPQPPPGLPAAPPPSPLSCGPGTSVNAATNQCEITCDGSSGRRMLADALPDESSDEPPTARDVVSTYMKSHPHLDEATVQHLVSLGRSKFEQHFWEPAFA